jgi:putative transposase
LAFVISLLCQNLIAASVSFSPEKKRATFVGTTSLRRSLGKKKALRAIKRPGHKESRWMKEYNRKLAKEIVDFALQFERPVIKMEDLGNIRDTCRTTSRSDRPVHSWAFYQLQQFIVERAQIDNVPVR